MSPVTAGLLLVVLVCVGVFFAFTKKNPFRQHYTVSAVVQTSNLVSTNSPVRIAGVNVGKVVSAGRYKDSNLAEITMEIDKSGRPIRKDATIKIRPRLFLEGNFYIEMHPGKPGSPEMPTGGTIPLSATAVPVQIDQVVSLLKTDTRTALQQTLTGLGDAFDSKPTAKEDESQDPEVQGLTGAEALNKTLETSPDALRDSAKVLQALRGQKRGDLTYMIKGMGNVTAALAEDQDALRGAVRNFNTTVTTLAANGPALQGTIRELGNTAAAAKTGFAQLDRAIGPTRLFAKDMTAAMKETPATIDASLPWLAQAKPALGSAELGGLVAELRPTVKDLSMVAHESRSWVPKLDKFSKCMNDVFLPAGKIKLDDGLTSSNVENYKEFFYALVAQAGEAQSFDGNGTKIRLQAIGGGIPIKSGLVNFNDRPLFSNIVAPSVGTSPAFTSVAPPLRRDVDCYRNPVPDLNGPASNGPGDGSRPSAPKPPLPLRNQLKGQR